MTKCAVVYDNMAYLGVTIKINQCRLVVSDNQGYKWSLIDKWHADLSCSVGVHMGGCQ